MWHPNIFVDGKVCISILHEPGENTEEPSNECWLPVHDAESILISVISMLTDPNPNLVGPANVDASNNLKSNPKEFWKKVRKLA